MNTELFKNVDFWASFGNILSTSVVIIKENGAVEYSNDIFSNLINSKVKNLFRLLSADCLEEFKNFIACAKNEQKSLNSNLKIKIKNGSTLHFYYYVIFLKNDLFSIILIDNTKINNELIMLNNIINTVPDPIFVKDDQFRFLYLNQASEEIWGIPAADILGKNNDEFFPKEEVAVFNKIDRKTFRLEKTIINEEKFTRIRGGDTRTISTKKSVFRTLTGHIILVGVSRDVTEINKARECLKQYAKELSKQVFSRTKQLETKTKELEKAVKKLENLNSDLDCFAHICCHELREPLRSISTYSNILISEYSNGNFDNLNNFLGIIHQGANRMDKIIKSILEYSTNGLHSNSNSSFSSNDLIIELLNMLELFIKEKDTKIHFDNLPVIYADRLQIIQLFQNLITNSIKFSSATTSPEIYISAVKTENSVEFQIKDNGIGIAKKHHKEIFLPFKRFHSRAEGSMHGIGLSLCKKIIENHGGTISMTSQENKGTTFKFSLPSEPAP